MRKAFTHCLYIGVAFSQAKALRGFLERARTSPYLRKFPEIF
jgi:hypothetical protein